MTLRENSCHTGVKNKKIMMIKKNLETLDTIIHSGQLK